MAQIQQNDKRKKYGTITQIHRQNNYTHMQGEYNGINKQIENNDTNTQTTETTVSLLLMQPNTTKPMMLMMITIPVPHPVFPLKANPLQNGTQISECCQQCE